MREGLHCARAQNPPRTPHSRRDNPCCTCARCNVHPASCRFTFTLQRRPLLHNTFRIMYSDFKVTTVRNSSGPTHVPLFHLHIFYCVSKVVDILHYFGLLLIQISNRKKSSLRLDAASLNRELPDLHVIDFCIVFFV